MPTPDLVLKRRHPNTNRAAALRYSVFDAADEHLSDRGDDANTRDMLAQLVAMLHASGAITDENVQSLLGSTFVTVVSETPK
jgi:hypothetical protein